MATLKRFFISSTGGKPPSA